jgi:hypothetical protein
VVLAIILTLVGAVCVAVGFVVQQHAAEDEPADERLSFRLLLHLVRRPLWLGGIAAMACGQILGAVALGRASLALIEPLMATNLLFALPLAAKWHHRRLGRREWSGTVALLVGMAAFLGAGDPHGGSTARLPWPNWVASGCAIALIAMVLVSMGKRRQPPRQATFFAAGAGCLYGLQDALTQRMMHLFGTGVGHALTTWPPYAVVAVAIVGLLLAQSAFEEAPLAASLPAITVAEPITGIAFGVGVYGEHLNLSGGLLVVELLGFIVMLAGMYLVASSQVVTGGVQASEPQAVVQPPVGGDVRLDRSSRSGVTALPLRAEGPEDPGQGQARAAR